MRANSICEATFFPSKVNGPNDLTVLHWVLSLKCSSTSQSSSWIFEYKPHPNHIRNQERTWAESPRAGHSLLWLYPCRPFSLQDISESSSCCCWLSRPLPPPPSASSSSFWASRPWLGPVASIPPSHSPTRQGSGEILFLYLYDKASHQLTVNTMPVCAWFC